MDTMVTDNHWLCQGITLLNQDEWTHFSPIKGHIFSVSSLGEHIYGCFLLTGHEIYCIFVYKDADLFWRKELKKGKYMQRQRQKLVAQKVPGYRETAYHAIKEAIFSGYFGYGQALIEEDIAAK